MRRASWSKASGASATPWWMSCGQCPTIGATPCGSFAPFMSTTSAKPSTGPARCMSSGRTGWTACMQIRRTMWSPTMRLPTRSSFGWSRPSGPARIAILSWIRTCRFMQPTQATGSRTSTPSPAAERRTMTTASSPGAGAAMRSHTSPGRKVRLRSLPRRPWLPGSRGRACRWRHMALMPDCGPPVSLAGSTLRTPTTTEGAPPASRA
mmetsp:Transcript_84973/g.166261  ORF Transcript_84973/g.166261 Transcript_84973/m.166261 type:complete len:208 (-) Transcript_84973:163-786(-)